GIGLAFCKSVMKSLGGDITCTSQYGEYTEFILTFPPLEKS
ncbi:MAG: ATP-binding protein, partial [Caedimonadaceae bacterium]